MSAELRSITPAQSTLRSFVAVGLLVLSLVLSAFLAGRASAIGQPNLGFTEAGPVGSEQFQVLGPDWTVRGNLSFLSSETVRVNVTSSTVDWLTNAAGGGSEDLVLQRYNGAVVTTVLFTQVSSGVVSQYTASINLSTFAIATDSYYLRIFIDDTLNTFEATSAISVGANPNPHSIETFTDNTFTRPTDVFTTTSVVWVRVRGDPDSDPDLWDIAEFVNANSPVGGPRGGFANFQRTGDVYTFSIDLAPFAPNFVSGWSYSLNVRLAAAAFDAGKQIQVFDPTLTILWMDIAPATARQGQTDVPMLALNLSLNPNWANTLGPASFNLERLRITRTGAGANADVAGIHVWDDRNGNGVLDGPDVRIASRTALGGVPSPAFVGTNGVAMTTVDSSGPRHLLITFDVSPNAVVGNFVGARIAAVADVDLAGHFASITGLPAQSSNVQIQGADVLTVTNAPAIAPASAPQAQPGVPIDLLTMSTNGAVLTVNSISVDLQGTGRPADVRRVLLHADNGDGLYDPATDPLLGTPRGFPPAGPAVFGGLGLPVGPAGRSVWIVFDLSPTATIGATVGSRLPDNTSFGVTGGSVFGATFPLSSGLTTIRGPLVTVTWANLAPPTARQGRSNVPMLRLTLSVDVGAATVTGFRLNKGGTSALDRDVAMAKVWLDDGDNLFDLGDTLLGKQVFVAGTTVIAGFSLPVSAGADRVLFVTYDIATTATVGATVTARLANERYVSVDPPASVDPGTFAIDSTPVQIVATGAGAILSVGSTDLAASTPRVQLGQADVAMEKLILSADANRATLTGLQVDKRGSSTSDGDVARVRLFLDADRDGVRSAGDAPLGSATFVGGTAIFGGLGVVVTAGQPVTLFLVIDVSPTATTGRTLGVSLANENYLAVDANSTVDPASFPIRSSDVQIVGGTVSGTVSDAAGNPLQGAVVSIPELGLATLTDSQGAYAFMDLPMGTYHVVARMAGFVDENQTATLTPAEPNKVVNFTLGRVPTGPDTGLLIFATLGLGLAVIALLVLLLGFVRRRSRCPSCGKPKPAGRELCAECEAKKGRADSFLPPPPPA